MSNYEPDKWDRACKGLMKNCVLCGNELPDEEDAPRPCPEINSEKVVKKVDHNE